MPDGNLRELVPQLKSEAEKFYGKEVTERETPYYSAKLQNGVEIRWTFDTDLDEIRCTVKSV